MKKRILIAIGDSFTAGIGCLHPDLFKQNWKNEQEKIEFNGNYIQMKYEVDNSWGKRLADKLNMDYFLNFGQPALDVGSSWKNFLECIPRYLFKDLDVYVIIICTYSHRLSVPFSNRWETLPLESELYKSFAIYMNNMNEDIENISNFESYSQLREATLQLNDWGWNWMIGFNDIVDEEKFIEKYPCYNNPKLLIKSIFEKGMFSGMSADKYLVEYDGHINEQGYEEVAKRMFWHIRDENSHWIGEKTNQLESFGIRIDYDQIMGWHRSNKPAHNLFKTHYEQRLENLLNP